MASQGDNDYDFCISEAKDIMAREAANKKVIVMIGDSTDISFDHEGLEDSIDYLYSHKIPAHSIVIRSDSDVENMDTWCDGHPRLTGLIGGWEMNHMSYHSSLQRYLGREIDKFRCF